MPRNLKPLTRMPDAYPFSIGQFRWWMFHAATNGLQSAVVRIGRRIYIDTDAFDRWIEAQQQVAA